MIYFYWLFLDDVHFLDSSSLFTRETTDSALQGFKDSMLLVILIKIEEVDLDTDAEGEQSHEEDVAACTMQVDLRLLLRGSTRRLRIGLKTEGRRHFSIRSAH